MEKGEKESGMSSDFTNCKKNDTMFTMYSPVEDNVDAVVLGSNHGDSNTKCQSSDPGLGNARSLARDSSVGEDCSKAHDDSNQNLKK